MVVTMDRVTQIQKCKTWCKSTNFWAAVFLVQASQSKLYRNKLSQKLILKTICSTMTTLMKTSLIQLRMLSLAWHLLDVKIWTYQWPLQVWQSQVTQIRNNSTFRSKLSSKKDTPKPNKTRQALAIQSRMKSYFWLAVNKNKSNSLKF